MLSIPLVDSNIRTEITAVPPTTSTISVYYQPTTTSTSQRTGGNSRATSSQGNGTSRSRNSILSAKRSTRAHPRTPPWSLAPHRRPQLTQPSHSFTQGHGFSPGRSSSTSTTLRAARSCLRPSSPQHTLTPSKQRVLGSCVISRLPPSSRGSLPRVHFRQESGIRSVRSSRSSRWRSTNIKIPSLLSSRSSTWNLTLRLHSES